MIPSHAEQQLQEYRHGNHPYPFGDFLTAVLANDLVRAAQYADSTNVLILHEYASYLYNKMPMRTGDVQKDYWGSYEAVANRIQYQQEHSEEGL